MMVRWLRVNAEGGILSSGQASLAVAALQRQGPAERLFIHDYAGDVDDAHLSVDFATLTLAPVSSEHSTAPGAGAALTEIL